MFELVENANTAVIRVIGVGGGGGNAVEHMVASNVEGVEFVCVNTDSQALQNASARTVLQLGTNVTKGLGAGANPEVGRQAALEDRERLVDLLQGSDMVFITAGMGGGTGTGASPVIAQIAREMGILTVAVVTKPFPFELKRRMTIAQEGIAELSEHVDSLITIPNEKLLSVLGDRVTLKGAFAAANDVLLGAVQGIAELITRPGMINVDFADVRTVMSEKGRAMMGSGRGTGRGRRQGCGRIRHALPSAGGCQSERRARDSRQHHGQLRSRHASSFTRSASRSASSRRKTPSSSWGPRSTSRSATRFGSPWSRPGSVTPSSRPASDGAARRVRSRPRPAVPESDPGGGASGSDYRRYEVPTIIRKQPERAEPIQMFEEDSDYQKIPVFLRRQKD